jgi:hypothetical protein
MNAPHRRRLVSTDGRPAEATPAELIDPVDLSPRERLVFSIGLHTASVVLGIGAWLDRHHPVRASLPLASPSRRPPGRRPKADSELLIERPGRGSEVHTGHRSGDAVIAGRRLGWQHPHDDDRVSSGRYERSA